MFLQIVKHQVGVSASEAQLRNPKPGKQADNLWCDTTTELLTMDGVSVNLFRPSGG